MRKFYRLSGMSRNPVKRLVSLPVLVFLLFMLSSGVVVAQDITVRGKVVSSDGNDGLPGVTVMELGTTNGTITDIEGNYTLNVASDAKLTFSFIGFKTYTTTLNGRNTVDVPLEVDISELEEVVITGYGSIRKSDVTSAHSTVSAEAMEKTVNTTIEQAIQGRAAGVYVTQNSGEPGGGISVNIRGINSINGNTEPLYVIDGVQIQGSQVEFGAQSSSNPLAGLNPTDIASMEILTGPSATALYGSRATNGVIVITTKRGKSGEMKINYGYQFSIQAEPKSLNVMDLREYARVNKEFREINGGNIPVEYRDPSLLGKGTDWQSELFSSNAMQKHQLSLSGGSESTKYYLSGEYLDQEGIALGSGFKRYSTRLNIDNQPKKWLKMGANMSFNQTEQKLVSGQENLISTAITMTPNIPVKNFDGTYAGGDPDNNPAEQFSPANPIGLSEITTNEQTRRQLLGGFNVTVDILEGLTFKASFNGNLELTDATYYVPAYQFGYQENPTGTLSEKSNVNTYWNAQQMLQYNKTFGKHTFGVMATHEAQKSNYRNLTAGISDFLTDEVVDLNLGNAETESNSGGKGSWAQESYLGRINYNFDDRYIVMANVRADGSSNFGANNKWGVFPSASMAWRVSEESFFNVPVINDFKFRYETGITGNQGGGGFIYGTLNSYNTPWGAGFALGRYSNPDLQWEETTTNNYGVDFALFKNRFQVEFDYYIKKTDNLLIETANPWYMGVTGTGSIGNPYVNLGSLENKGWSFTVKTTNIDRKGFQWTTDLNLSAVKTKVTSLSTETGFYARTSWWMDDWTQRSTTGESPWLFFGYIEDGIFQSLEEIESSALPVDNNGVELPIAENSVWVGDVKYKDISGPEGVPDGIIDSYDQTYMGNPYPKLYGGITNNFSYKGFDLSILITAVYGNDIYNYLAYENSNPNNVNIGRNMLSRALGYARIGTDSNGDPYIENPETDVARISSNDVNGNYSRHTTKYVEDGSFIRIKNISLTYNFPTSLLSNVNFIHGARVTLSAQNVATFTKYSGYDPEVGSSVGRNVSASNQAIGVDNGRYPLTPVYSFSLGIDF